MKKIESIQGQESLTHVYGQAKPIDLKDKYFYFQLGNIDELESYMVSFNE